MLKYKPLAIIINYGQLKFSMSTCLLFFFFLLKHDVERSFKRTFILLSTCKKWFLEKAKYILELEDNLEALQEVATRLKAVKDDLQKKIEMEERRGLRALDEFNVWLSEVEVIQPKVTKLLEDRTSEIERLSMCGYCSSNFFLTYRYGKDVLETKGH
ncbi:hypothetical protein YC2023_100447 [Brassica napus]